MQEGYASMIIMFSIHTFLYVQVPICINIHGFQWMENAYREKVKSCRNFTLLSLFNFFSWLSHIAINALRLNKMQVDAPTIFSLSMTTMSDTANNQCSHQNGKETGKFAIKFIPVLSFPKIGMNKLNKKSIVTHALF